MCVATGINLDSGIALTPNCGTFCSTGWVYWVWKKSLIEVIQIRAIESLFFCGASDLVFRVVRDEFLKFWHGYILMFNTVNETVKFNHYSQRVIPTRVWNSLGPVAHKPLYLNAECVLCSLMRARFRPHHKGKSHTQEGPYWGKLLFCICI